MLASLRPTVDARSATVWGCLRFRAALSWSFKLNRWTRSGWSWMSVSLDGDGVVFVVPAVDEGTSEASAAVDLLVVEGHDEVGLGVFVAGADLPGRPGEVLNEDAPEGLAPGQALGGGLGDVGDDDARHGGEGPEGHEGPAGGVGAFGLEAAGGHERVHEDADHLVLMDGGLDSRELDRQGARASACNGASR